MKSTNWGDRMHQDQDTLGQYLKQKRESVLVPVQEIALATGSKKALIQALEEDDYSIFTQRSQAQLLVKQVAAYLKLDESDILRRFEFQWKEHSRKKEFPKLSAFADNEKPHHTPTVIQGMKTPINRRIPKLPRIKIPGIFKIPQMPDIPKMKLRVPIIFATLLIGLFLVIDLPFSKHKPPPPVDPRFSDVEKKPPPAMGGHAQTAPAQEEKKETVPLENPPPRENITQSSASQGKNLSSHKNGKIVGNSDSKRYHLPGMKYYDKIQAYHRVTFQTEKEAIGAGYRKARE